MTIHAEETQDGVIFHLHLSDNSPCEESTLELADGKSVPVLWKDVLVEGVYPMSPAPGGAVEEPLTVVRQGESDAKKRIISMSDLEFAHEDGAFKYVTIPTTHRDGVLDNTGYVPRPKGVRVIEKEIEGKKRNVFQAALGFTEPDVKGKVQRGTIPDVSGGIFFNWKNKAKAKVYRCAMKHVALTPNPFMGNLDGFAPVYAADEEIDADKLEIKSFVFDATGDTGGSGESSTTTTGEIVWNETEGMGWIRDQVDAALNPEPDPNQPPQERPFYYVQDVSTGNHALVNESFRGKRTRFVVPFSKNNDGQIEISPPTRWVEAKEAMIAASDDSNDNKLTFADLSAEKVKEKLSLALSEELGGHADGYRVEEVSLDSRARIVSKVDGAQFVAPFVVRPGGTVFFAEPSSQWERLAPAPPEADAPTPPASAPSNVEIAFSEPIDTSSMEGRLRAARQRRRQLLSS